METGNRKAWDMEKVFIERADALRGLRSWGCRMPSLRWG